jgi:hypothetical protein
MDGDARNSNSHILSLLYSPYSYELKLRTSDLIINELFYNCEVLVIHIDDVTLW